MTQSPTPDRDPQPTPRRRRFRQFRRIALPVSLGLLAGLGGVAIWGWRYIQEELPGIVAQNLSQTLNRTVSVGEVEGLSLTGLRLGRSGIPPTAADTDQATVETIDVGFNLLQTLWTGKLKLDITLENAEIFLEQQKEGWITTKLTPAEDEGRIELGTIRVENSRAKLLGLGTINGKRSPVTLNQLNGRVDLFDKNKRFTYELTGRSQTGGEIDLTGETLLPGQETNLQVQAKNFLVSEVDRLLNLPFDLPQGRGGGNFNVQLRPNIKNPPITGTAQFAGVTLAIPGVPRPFTNAKGTLQFRGSQISPEGVVGTYGKATGTVNGSIDLNRGFNLSANVKPIGLKDLTDTLNVPLPVPIAGQITADLKVTGAIQKPVLSGVGRSTQPGKVDRIALNQYSATFKLDTAAEEVVIQRLQVTPAAGGQVTGSGRIDLGSTDPSGKVRPELALNFLVLNVPGDPVARAYNNGNPLPVTIGTVNAQAQVSGPANNVATSVRWSAPNATYAGSGEIRLANGVTTLRNTTFKVEGGTVGVNAVAANGRWQAAINGNGIPLNRFSNDLRGLLSGQFTASGSLTSPRPSDIRAQGTARLSEGVPGLARPLTAQVQWNGRQIVLQQATATGFSANGTIGVQLEGTPAITGLNLNVALQDYNLQDAPVSVPGNIAYSGRADFTGKVTGTPAAPAVNGNLALKRLVVNSVAFEPYLQGRVQYDRGVRLDLNGRQDRIAAVLDSRFRPVTFEVRRGEAIARGRTQGELLLTEIRNFPLALARSFVGGQFSPSGKLDANLAINLDRQTASGDVQIDQPGFGAYRADRFTGRLSYANGVATLTNGQLQQGNSILEIGGVANLLGSNPQFKGSINILQANIQEVLTALQIFELEDLQQFTKPRSFGRAADLQTAPINATNVPIQEQLRRLSEIEALQAQSRARREAAIVPSLSELRGSFSGKIDVTASLRSGINTNFNIRGQDFAWGRFKANEIVAVGSFANGELTLLPLRLQSDDAVIAFSGQLLGANQSGQLRVENFPIATLTDLVKLPLNVDGRLNATATISGSFTNPQAVGQYNLTNGTLNNTPLQRASGNFTYTSARLEFSNTLAITETEPLSIIGSVPYQLPFATVAPTSDRISLTVDVKNEGLALLNVLNNQVEWVDGQGEVRLRVRGTLKNPIATGIVRVQNASLRAKALPDPLTNVTGVARFDQDRIRVEQFAGDFSKGKVAATGVIPLANPLAPTDPDRANPLTVALNTIDLNLKGLYQGGVDGTVIITGAALDPVIGGEVRLSRGQVLLTEAVAGNGQANGQGNGQAERPSNVGFSNLKLTLGNGILLTSYPVLQFVAQGDLLINGTLDQPAPTGVIRLQSGQVNLFTTQFRLERGYPQTAEFTPRRGLDPELNVRLIAQVSEVTNRRQPSVLAPSEILDVPAPASSFGSLQTVRIRAQVTGPASNLAENLSLTSSPPRSEEEIVALIGGSYVDTFGRGDTLVGLANLAGTALLSNVQNVIANTLGLSEFRIYPTTITDDERESGRTGGTFGVAAEAAVDVTPAFSVSVLKILTNNQPPQFGVRYRLNDNLLLRSSTDFSGDTRGSIEFETRF